MVMDKVLKEKIERVIKEFIKREEFRKYGFVNCCKLLFYGVFGIGKIMIVGVLVKELNFFLFIVRIEKVVIKFMGEIG